MSHLLLEIKGNRLFNRVLFAPRLKVYDDVLTFRQRKLFSVDEFTANYRNIVQVSLKKGIFFAAIEIINSGGVDTVRIRWVKNKAASKAKKIIDQKSHQAQARQLGHSGSEEHVTKRAADSFERALNRYKELLNRGKISKSEYNKARKKLLHKV